LVFEQAAEAAVQKSNLFCPAFICFAEKWLEGWILGYQQVIHNAKMPTEGNCTSYCNTKIRYKRGTGIV
jgi:hypothetical protein